MIKLILNCITLSSKKNLFFIQWIVECVLISSSINNNSFLEDLEQNKLSLNFIQISRDSFLKLIFSYFGNTFKYSPKKNLYTDILKMKAQNFLFFFFTSFPICIKCETDFDYLSTGWVFLFFKASNNLLRSTGTLIYLYILYVKSNFLMKKRKINTIMDFDKKTIEALCLNSVKEVEILSKIILIKNQWETLPATQSLNRHRSPLENSVFTIKNILLEIKGSLKDLKLFHKKKKDSLVKKDCKYIFGLQFVKMYKIISKKILKRKKKKKNFIFILKNYEIFKIFKEFVSTMSMYLIFEFLQQKLKNFYVYVFMYCDYFSLFNTNKGYCFNISRIKCFLKDFSNYIVKILLVIELNSNYCNSFWVHYFLNKFRLTIFSKKNLRNGINKHFRFTLPEEWFWVFLFPFNNYDITFNGKIQLFFTTFPGILPIRLIILLQKKNISKKINITSNYFLGTLIKYIIVKQLKKITTSIILISSYRRFFFSQKSYKPKRIKKFLFFSNNDLVRNSIILLPLKREKYMLVSSLIFIRCCFIALRKGIVIGLSSESYTITKIFKRYKRKIELCEQLKFLLIFNLMIRTQTLSLKIYIISKYINSGKTYRDQSVLDIFIKKPVSLTLRFNLMLNSLKRRNWIKKGNSVIFTLEETELKNLLLLFTQKIDTKWRIFLYETKKFLFFIFIKLIKNFIPCKNKFLYWGIQLFSSKSTNFWKNVRIFLNIQVNGFYSYNEYYAGITLKNKIKNTSLCFFNFQKVQISIKFYQNRSFFNYIKKNIFDFLFKLPFSTTLNIIFQKNCKLKWNTLKMYY